jgi:hypothetical protein
MKCQSFRWYTKISLGKKNFWVIESELKVFLIGFFQHLGYFGFFQQLGYGVFFSTAWVWCATNLSLLVIVKHLVGVIWWKRQENGALWHIPLRVQQVLMKNQI